MNKVLILILSVLFASQALAGEGGGGGFIPRGRPQSFEAESDENKPYLVTKTIDKGELLWLVRVLGQEGEFELYVSPKQLVTGENGELYLLVKPPQRDL